MSSLWDHWEGRRILLHRKKSICKTEGPSITRIYLVILKLQSFVIVLQSFSRSPEKEKYIHAQTYTWNLMLESTTIYMLSFVTSTWLVNGFPFLSYHLKEREHTADSLRSSTDSYHGKHWPSWGNLWEWKKKSHFNYSTATKQGRLWTAWATQGTWLLCLQNTSRITATTDEAAEAKEETLRSQGHKVCQTFQPSATILRKSGVRPLPLNTLLSKMQILPESKPYLLLKLKPLPVLYLEHNDSWGHSLMVECWDVGFNSHPH